MSSVLEPGGVSEQSVHYELIVGVHSVQDGPERHPVLHGPDDHLEVGVADLRQEHVQPRPLLEPPSVLVCPVRLDQQARDLQHDRVLGLQ